MGAARVRRERGNRLDAALSGYAIADDGPPAWLPQLREIAGRLAVEATNRADAGSLLTVGWQDEHYDVGALVLALLDRVAAA
jgi:hypothetical protein